MAIIKDQNEQEQDGGQLGSQAVGTVSGGGAGNPAAGQAAPQAKGSGNFVNLSRYMDANKDNQAVGNSISDIDKTGQAAQDSFKGAQDNFNGLKVDGPKDLSQDSQNYLSGFNPKKYSYNTDSSGRAYTSELNDISKNMAGTQYKGPSAGDIQSSATGYANTFGNLNNTAQTFAASPDGVATRRQTLTDANSQRAGGNYGAGAANLDSLLTERQGQPTFDARREAIKNMAGTYDQAGVAARTADLTKQVNNAQNTATANYGAASSQYNKIKDAWNKTTAARDKSQAGMAAAGISGGPNGYTGTIKDAYVAPAPVAQAAPTQAPKVAATPKEKEDTRKARIQ